MKYRSIYAQPQLTKTPRKRIDTDTSEDLKFSLLSIPKERRNEKQDKIRKVQVRNLTLRARACIAENLKQSLLKGR